MTTEKDDSLVDRDRPTDHFPNPYLAASSLPPGRERLEAVHQFLDEEQHRLYEQLQEIERPDGSIPKHSTHDWSLTKGKLDQTRLFLGLVAEAILTAERDRRGDDGE